MISIGQQANCRIGVQHQPTPLPIAVGPQRALPALVSSRNRCHVCYSAAFPGSGRRSQQIVQFRQRDAAGDVEQQELEYLHLDFDCTELLDLHGRESYLLCDVTKAHDYLWTLPLAEGYSQDVIDGRRELLDSIKERALLQEGKVKQENKGIDVPVQLLPSALALLAQINQNDSVYDLASKLLDNWDMRKTYKRDIILSLAVARCNIARDLLADQKVADGCSVLEDALALLQSAGDPPLAPGLAADIHNAVDGFVVQRILDQLRSPITPDALPARRKAVAMLKELLSKESGSTIPRMLGGGFFASATPAASENGSDTVTRAAAGATVSADYVRLVVDCMTSQELVGMANWDQVARSASSTTWLYPGLLQIAATAHIAVGFIERRPAVVRTGTALLRAVPASCEVLLLRAVANVLLGEPEAAVICVKEAASAQPDDFISWPSDQHATAGHSKSGDEDQESDLVATTRLPPGPDAYSFLVAHSADDPELLAGLCLYTEVFLSKVVFAGFPDTAQLQGSSTSLPAYFDSPQVQQQLEEDKERSAGLAGSLSSMMDAVMSVQPLVQQFAESAKSAGSKLGNLGVQLKDSGRTPAVNRLAADMGFADGRAVSPEDADYDAAWDEQQVPGSNLVSQVRGTAAAGAAAAQAAASNLAVGLEQAKGELEGRLGSKWPAAVGAAALAVVVAGVALTRRSSPNVTVTAAAPNKHTVQQQAASATTALKELSKNQALKLVKRFQAAKAAALSSNFDTSKLGDACVGPALAQFHSMAEDWSAKGWFRKAEVWKLDIIKLEPRSKSGQRVAVTARIGETSSTWGVDGQQGNNWSNEYDVEYDVVLCSDMQWRIQGVQVKGK